MAISTPTNTSGAGWGQSCIRRILSGFGRMRRCPRVPTPQPHLRTSPTTSVHVPLRGRRHPTTAGGNTPPGHLGDRGTEPCPPRRATSPDTHTPELSNKVKGSPNSLSVRSWTTPAPQRPVLGVVDAHHIHPAQGYQLLAHARRDQLPQGSSCLGYHLPTPDLEDPRSLLVDSDPSWRSPTPHSFPKSRFGAPLSSTLAATSRFDIVPGRTAESAAAWFRSQPTEWCEAIRWAVLDMSGPYRKAYNRVLPHALQVADPFHVIRLANQRLDEVRRRVQNETLGHRGRKDDPLYRIRRLLTAAHERISDRGQVRLRWSPRCR